jgi:hypothetical protein
VRVQVPPRPPYLNLKYPMKLVDFPHSEKLSIKHGPYIRSLAAHYPPYSEFNFTNLFAWNTDGIVEVSQSNDGLVLLLQNHKTKEKFYTFIGVQDADSLAKQLITKSLDGCLRLVPQVVATHLSSSDFIIQEDRNNFDYILSANYHAQLVGHQNEKRRYLIKKFLQENGTRLVVKNLDLTDKLSRADILLCMSQWILKSSKDPIISAIESTAIARVLDAADQLPIRALGFYIDDLPRAFSIFEKTHDSTGIVHFEKCDISYKGLAQYARNSVAKEFLVNGLQHINYEQDLGLEGLRKAKSMLHPDSFLKKYTVRIKN